MPEIDGITVCEQLRSESDVPIVMLTSLEDESDAAAALEAGADDYIRKPFGANELMARLRAVLRRTVPEQGKSHIVAGDIHVDVRQHIVSFKGEEINLSKTEFALLTYLLSNPNRVLTHDQILERIWGSDYVGAHHVLRVCLSRLKQRFSDSSALSIESLAGVGYRIRLDASAQRKASSLLGDSD
jgi:DNA-binding response OmpR family regulator